MINGYMTVKEAAEKWGISERAVQMHCKKGIIPGVTRVGRNWLIPEGTNRPTYMFVCTNDNEKNEVEDK